MEQACGELWVWAGSPGPKREVSVSGEGKGYRFSRFRRPLGGKDDFVGLVRVGDADHRFPVGEDAIDEVVDLLIKRMVSYVGTVGVYTRYIHEDPIRLQDFAV